MRLGQGKELQDRRCDYAERSLGTDEKLLQVIAGVVLAQTAQAVPHLPRGQHDLESQHELASIAIAQHRGADRVVGQIAADFAASLGGEAQWKQPAGLFGGLLQVGQHAPGLHRHGVVSRIDRADPVHARKIEDDLRTACIRRRGAAKACVSALWDDRHARFGAGAHHLGHLGGGGRLDDRGRSAYVAFAPVARVGRDLHRRRDQPRRPDDGLNFFDERSHFGLMARPRSALRYPSLADGLERVSHLRDGRPVVLRAENRGTRDEGIGPGARDAGDVPGVYAAVHFQHDCAPRVVDFPACVAQLFQGVGDELLPAKSRIHRHDENQVELVQDVIEAGQRRGGVQYKARLAARIMDQADGAIDVLARLRVEADDVRPGASEIRNDPIDRSDHQVHVDYAFGERADCLAHDRSHREVRDVMIVHHVEVNHVGSRCDNRSHFIAEPRKVCRQDARCDSERACSHRGKFYLDSPGAAGNGDHPALVSPRDFVWNDRMVAEKKYEVAVSSQTQYVPEQSDEQNARFVFAYTITIRNDGSLPAQLISRHWIITDGRNQVQEVRGLGVVGAQPLLKPGESFEYTSGTAIATPVGTMRGSYQMVAEDGTRFDAPIPEFTLSVPRVLH